MGGMQNLLPASSRLALSLILCTVLQGIAPPLVAGPPRSLPSGTLPNDARLKPLKDLNGYFPFDPPASAEAWAARADRVRRQIIVAEGLWPMPTKTPLNAVIHGRIDKGDYTVEKVYFESAPGFFVTGNLYRPKHITGKVPAVLFAHGHWKDARLSEATDEAVQKELETGQEKFARGGRSMFQSMCVQLARMGCVVWQWDMLSDSDSVQLPAAVVHHFAKQRPEMNATENWGLYSPQAEAHLQSVMGLQTWNAIRSLDFVLSLPEVDSDRIAVTGASGGGTQTMLLSAIDPRVKLSFPAVMVSTAMQGGCTCENTSLLRTGTGNVEFAALFAPKPLGMTTANDWTKEMSTKGFPDLQKLYKLLGHPDDVTLVRGEHFPHNYNAVSRAGFYRWLNQHFKLGPPEIETEKDYDLLHRDQLTVWDNDHPAPKAADPDFERQLLAWFTKDAEQQIEAAAKSPDEFRKVALPAIEALIGRTYDTAGDTEWSTTTKVDRGDYLEMTGLVRNKTHNEELPVVWLYPKKWNGRVVLWLDDNGKSALFDKEGTPKPAIAALLKSGATVVGADLLYQGEFLPDGQPLKQTRVIENNREAPSYTFGYNHPLFAQRAHDVLTLLKHIRTADVDKTPSPKSVALVGLASAGPISAAALAVAANSVDTAAIKTGNFRFASILNYRDPMFLPGGAKYLDLPGMLALNNTTSLALTADNATTEFLTNYYKKSKTPNRLHVIPTNTTNNETEISNWLTKSVRW